MSTADFSRIKKRAISIVLADPSYSATVSGDVGRYLSTQEFIDTALQKDAELMTTAIENDKHWVRSTLTPTLSSALQNGGSLPSGIVGKVANVVVSDTSGGTYIDATEMEDKDDILAVNEDSSLFGDGSTDHKGYYVIDNNKIWTTSPYAKVYYYTFSIGASPQSPEAFEDAIAHGVVSSLFKDGSITPDIHEIGEKKFQQKLAEIRSFGKGE